MPRAVLLLRGINVGRHNRLRMPDLVAMLEHLGCTGVSTYLQSGNALVGTDEPLDALVARVEATLADVGVAVPVLARTRDDLDAVLAADPFSGRDLDDAKVHVAFLSAAPDPEAVAGLDPTSYAPEELVVQGREAWLYYVRGVQNTRMTRPLAGLDVVATARNRRTVRTVRDLL